MFYYWKNLNLDVTLSPKQNFQRDFAPSFVISIFTFYIVHLFPLFMFVKWKVAQVKTYLGQSLLKIYEINDISHM